MGTGATHPCSAAAAAWLRRLEALLRDTALPALRALEGEWRAAVGATDTTHPLRFRASVRRSGAASTPPDVTSIDMEQVLGGLAPALGWSVALKIPFIRVALSEMISAPMVRMVSPTLKMVDSRSMMAVKRAGHFS